MAEENKVTLSALSPSFFMPICPLEESNWPAERREVGINLRELRLRRPNLLPWPKTTFSLLTGCEQLSSAETKE